MNAAAYFRRMRCDPVVRADAPTLSRLQRAHLQAVPFENLDIRRGRPLSLDLDDLFDKIVVRRRGGICYELNVLFAWLLTASGFDVSLIAAEVHADDGTVGPAFDHMALLVRVAGQRLLADVGFGDSFLEPLDIDVRGELHGACSGHDVLEDGPCHVVMAPTADARGRVASFRFDVTPRSLGEFEPMFQHHQHSSDSPFTRRDVCSMALPDGRVTVSGTQLIETHRGRRRVTELIDEAARADALCRHFGVSV